MNELTIRELEASALFYFKNGDFPNALIYLKKIATKESVAVTNLAHLARTYAKLHLFDESVEMYQFYLGKCPKAHVENFQLGLVYLELNLPEKAKYQWDVTLNLEPDFPPALYYKALVHVMERETTPAVSLLEHLLNTVTSNNLYFELANKLYKKLKESSEQPITLEIDTPINLEGRFDA